jgi:xylulokinase
MTASIDDRTGTHAVSGLPFSAARGEVMAALIKGLAVEADRTTAALAHVTSTVVDSVTVAGVPTRSHVWRRIRRQASGHPLRFVAEPEATVLGVALLAQQGVTGAADRPTSFVS